MDAIFGGEVDFVCKYDCEPSQDIDLVRQTLAELSNGGRGVLRLHRPAPTAAFSTLDGLRPSYADACALVNELGFEPVARPAGGHLAVYDDGAVVIDLVAPHSDPRAHTMRRFEQIADAIKLALSELEFKADIGPVDNEYCPGKYSLSIKGKKIAGLAQKLVRGGYHLGVVIMVGSAVRAGQAMSVAYPALGLPFDGATVGCLADTNPALEIDSVMAKISTKIGLLLDVQRPPLSIPSTVLSGQGRGHSTWPTTGKLSEISAPSGQACLRHRIEVDTNRRLKP